MQNQTIENLKDQNSKYIQSKELGHFFFYLYFNSTDKTEILDELVSALRENKPFDLNKLNLDLEILKQIRSKDYVRQLNEIKAEVTTKSVSSTEVVENKSPVKEVKEEKKEEKKPLEAPTVDLESLFF